MGAIKGNILTTNFDWVPLEKYNAIIVDIPWPYSNNKSKRSDLGGYSYNAMTMDQIKSIPIMRMAADNCVLYLWGTWPKFCEMQDVISAWNLELKTGFPWIKMTKDNVLPKYGPGYWVSGCSEFCVICTIGKVSPPPPPRYLGLVGPSFNEHSRKPDDIHSMIEYHIKPPYLELFARRPRLGWDCFGNQIPTGSLF